MKNVYIDVTEVLRTPYTSGIQRVVREFVRRLVRQKENIVLLRYLPAELCYAVVAGSQFEAYCAGDPEPLKAPMPRIALEQLDQTDVFLDMDSVWNKFEERRQWVYGQLKKRGVIILSLVYDILPITHPQFFNDDTLFHFLLYLSAVLAYSDIIVVNSQATKHRLEELAAQGRVPQKRILVVPLGADFKEKSVVEADAVDEKAVQAAAQPFLMMLGTVEPRKNHQLLLDAYDQGLRDLPVNIVIAGRKGWKVDALLARIEGHPDLNKRIFFVEAPSDQTVSYLYQHTFGLVFASFGEGFGLPLVEAMHYGKLSFASDIEVFREIGQDRCVYFDPNDPLSLIAGVKRTLSDPAYTEGLKRKIRDYHVTSWDEAAGLMAEAIGEGEKLTAIPECPETALTPEQLYMISARTEDLLETLPYFEHFMPYLRRLVVGCPKRVVSEIKASYQGSLQLSFLTDEELLQGRPLPRDHQARNLLLRSLAMRHPALDPVFIMADDDNRPLQPIPITYFAEDGRFKLYYCKEDLRGWQGYIGGLTSYDRGIRNTAEFMEKNGLPRRQYSAHAPQIICKRIFAEALARYPETEGMAIDEWSLYGNYAMGFYQPYFRPLPYTTMCWPAMPSDWKVTVPPREYCFENFYRHLYAEGELFAGFSTALNGNTEAENAQKKRLRFAQQNAYTVGMAVDDALDQVYREKVGAPPDWEVNLDQRYVLAPKVLAGKCGYIKKAPLRIQNSCGCRHLRIEGSFQDQASGEIFGFQQENLDVAEMNGVYEINIHFPKKIASGFLRVRFIADQVECAEAAIPFFTV